MRKFLFFVICFLIFSSSFAQNKKAYQIFNSKGKKISYQKMIQSIQKSDILLFGELHNNPITHWLQYEVSVDLLTIGSLTFGAEMFEADNQKELNLYLTDSISYKTLDSLARLWSNYKTDYAPLVNLAKKYKQKFIATNIPRRYANLVYKEGFDALDSLRMEEKKWISPLPIEYNAELPGYKNILAIAGGHGGPNLPKAQAIKDATMAYFISENYETTKKFIHFNGTYHSENYEGILWYLKKWNSELTYITISTVSQSSVEKLDDMNKGKADFIICVDENMTTTY